MIVGVDFGARLSGTTVLCFDEGPGLQLVRVAKRQDADAYLERFVVTRAPSALYIDAPLSLPAAYCGRGQDFFYRACDRAVAAMSPMFLGGLTARAVSLKYRLAPTPVYEVYPRAAARALEEQGVEGYREASPTQYFRCLAAKLPRPALTEAESWHEVDAVLAWWSGWRHAHGEARCFGDPSEGLIWV